MEGCLSFEFAKTCSSSSTPPSPFPPSTSPPRSPPSPPRSRSPSFPSLWLCRQPEHRHASPGVSKARRVSQSWDWTRRRTIFSTGVWHEVFEWIGIKYGVIAWSGSERVKWRWVGEWADEWEWYEVARSTSIFFALDSHSLPLPTPPTVTKPCPVLGPTTSTFRLSRRFVNSSTKVLHHSLQVTVSLTTNPR